MDGDIVGMGGKGTGREGQTLRTANIHGINYVSVHLSPLNNHFNVLGQQFFQISKRKCTFDVSAELVVIE